MYEIVLMIFMVFTIAKIAHADGQSGILWGVVALLFGVLCFRFIHLQFGRVLVAGMLTYAAMTAYKLARR